LPIKERAEGKTQLKYSYHTPIYQAISRYHLFDLKENIFPIEQKTLAQTNLFPKTSFQTRIGIGFI